MKIKFEFKLTMTDFAAEFVLGNRTFFSIEKEFEKTFTCAQCKEKVEDDGQILRLCDQHRFDFVETWHNRWIDK